MLTSQPVPRLQSAPRVSGSSDCKREAPHCPRQDYNTIQTQALANMALLLSSSRAHAKGKLALRFQGQVVHALRLFLQEKQKGPVGNTMKLCLNSLHKALPAHPSAAMRAASMGALLSEGHAPFLSSSSQAHLPGAHLPGPGGGAAAAAAAVDNNQEQQHHHSAWRPDREAPKCGPALTPGWGLVSGAALTRKREKDHKGSDVPFRLEQLPAPQPPQYLLCSDLQLVLQLISRTSHLSDLPQPPKGPLSPGLSQAVHSLTLP